MDDIEKEDSNDPSIPPEELFSTEVEDASSGLESTTNRLTFEDRLQSAIDEALTAHLIDRAVEKAIRKTVEKALRKSIQAAVDRAVERLNSVSDDVSSNSIDSREKLVLHLGCPDPAGKKIGFIGQGGPTPCHTTTPEIFKPLNPNKKKPAKPK